MECKKYKKGFLVQQYRELDEEWIEQLKWCKTLCEKLVIGVPEDSFSLRITDTWPEPCYEGQVYLLSQAGVMDTIVDEVVSIDINNIAIRESYEQIKYDVYFFGTEYGKQFEKDKVFLQENKVEMVSLVSDKMTIGTERDALWYALQNVTADRKVVLFGSGKYFEYYMSNYGEKYPPIYAVDNDSQKWDTKKSGVLIKNPNELEKENPQKVIIILCCKNYKDILKQILRIGAFDYRILLYNSNVAVVEEYRVIWQEQLSYIAKAHEILMRMMREFDRVCTDLGLHYYVISGSLIGVVRHKGLIPWDDDIDVAMPYYDYKILKEKAKEIWKQEEYLFLDYDDIGDNVFYDFMTRIVDLQEEIPTGLFRKVKGKAREDIMNHMVIDIYVLADTVPGIRHDIVTTMLKGIYTLAMGHRGYIDYKEYGRLSENELVILRIINKIGRMIPLKFIFKLYEMLRTYAKNKNTKEYFESNGIINYMPWLYKKKLFGEGTRLPMQDLMVMVPQDYHGLLKAKGYGNYMEYPSVQCRKPSHTAKGCGVIW